MKKLEELPAVLQLDLILLKDYILSEVPSAALIYLYGPCSQEPFEGPDYDLLIVTSKTNAYQAKLNIERSKGRYYCSANSQHKHLHCITVPISRF